MAILDYTCAGNKDVSETDQKTLGLKSIKCELSTESVYRNNISQLLSTGLKYFIKCKTFNRWNFYWSNKFDIQIFIKVKLLTNNIFI